MVPADRDLRLAGYEIFRFGASELVVPGRKTTSRKLAGSPIARAPNFPGTGIQESLTDKAKKLGIPIWKLAARKRHLTERSGSPSPTLNSLR